MRLSRPITPKQVLMHLIRWGIAVGGITWVITNMTLRDQLTVLDDRNVPAKHVYLGGPLTDSEGTAFVVRDPIHGEPSRVPVERVIHDPDRSEVTLTMPEGGVEAVRLLGMRLTGDINRSPRVTRLLVLDDNTAEGRWIAPDAVAGGFQLKVPQPLVETGLISLVRGADPWLLMLSVAVFPMTFLMTSLRWHRLMRAAGIRMRLARATVLNLVGCFYNSFMLGSSGGDVLKAYYAARHSHDRTAAVTSVFVDRAVGLLTLIVMGGLVATTQYLRLDPHDPTAVACRQVAILTATLTLVIVAGGVSVTSSRLRRLVGIEWVLRRTPGRGPIRRMIEVLTLYRRRPGLVLWAMAVTVPVHLTVIVSAWLAGRAFGLPISTGYYFVVVPVVVLVGSLPISPQGAGVMEFFAVTLTARQGATVGEAFALTMSIRLVQLFWNLVAGGAAVARGGFGSPSERDRAAAGLMADESPEGPATLDGVIGVEPAMK